MKRPVNLLATLSTIAVLLLAPFVSIGHASADPLGTITRYSTPATNSQPYDIVTGPDGNMWFTEYGTAKIGRTQMSGSMTEFALPSGYSKPQHITAGPNGVLWFTALGGANMYALGEISLNGSIVMHDLPDPLDRRASYSASYYSPKTLLYAGGYLWLSSNTSRYLTKVDSTGSATQVQISTPELGNGILATYRAGMIAYDSYAGDGIWVFNTHSDSSESNNMLLEKIAFDGTRSLMQTTTDYDYAGDLAIDPYGTFWFGSNSALENVNYMTRQQQTGNLAISGLNNDDQAKSMVMGPDGALWIGVHRTPNDGYGKKIARIDPITHESSAWTISTGGSKPMGMTVGPDMNVWFTENVGHKISRIGTGLSSTDDQDNDSLNLANELAQGTIDTDSDMDNDGLSDYVESVQLTGRDAIFCNPATNYCEYPDPLRKDIYVEADWMYRNGGTSLPSYSTQPGATIINPVKNAFAAKGIDLHVDTGQLGGGNEVDFMAYLPFAPTEGAVDLYDYQNGTDGMTQNFASNRRDVWHYMLVGYNYLENPDSSGLSFVGGDDLFISYGLFKETANPPYASFETAMAGTIIHELGHSLCLKPGVVAYPQQSNQCLFDGIDSSSASTDYVSSMNYLYQLELVDYSDGQNGANDHDDWSALGLDDFVHRDALGDLSPGITIEEARKAKKLRDASGISIYKENGKYKVEQVLSNGKMRQLE
jgi:streptogramin lyase